MDQHAIILRAANPQFEDGLACARYLDQSAEGFIHFWLGPRADNIVAKAFLEPDHNLSYQNVTFAERGSETVGMVCAFTAEQHHRFSLEPLQRAAGERNLRKWILDIIFAPMMRIVDSIPDGDFYLNSIAVDEEVRGDGVGSVLMDFVEERGRASGSTRLSLDVSAKNQGACRFYERRGMRVDSRWPKRFPIPGLTFYRMTKGL